VSQRIKDFQGCEEMHRYVNEIRMLSATFIQYWIHGDRDVARLCLSKVRRALDGLYSEVDKDE
jgi:hypothetical protein